jgi:hypothetical protein
MKLTDDDLRAMSLGLELAQKNATIPCKPDVVLKIVNELRDARKLIDKLQTELAQAKTAATYGAKMVAEMSAKT